MAEKKGKKARSKSRHKNAQVWKFYESGKDRKFCPRCGEGTFMANHKNRRYCGRCGLTEFVKE